MSTDHEIFKQKIGHYEPELYVYEQSMRFSIGVSDRGGDPRHMEDLTLEELGAIAFRLLEVVSYYDPGFEGTFPKASHYVQTELRRVLK